MPVINMKELCTGIIITARQHMKVCPTGIKLHIAGSPWQRNPRTGQVARSPSSYIESQRLAGRHIVEVGSSGKSMAQASCVTTDNDQELYA
jgi:hypothetical protein